MTRSEALTILRANGVDATDDALPWGVAAKIAVRLDAALDLLEATDRAWREGEPPPVERIRTLLSECGRGL